jgi:acyl transferase domain-containing protein/acyl carrier protein
LVVAGVLDVPNGALLVARRAQLMMENCDLMKTSMLAVNIGATDAQAMIEGDDRFNGLAISCNNSPTDCVVGGFIPQLQAFKEHLTGTGNMKSKFLDVPMAYHTEAMEPMLAALTEYASTLVLKKPSIPVISNVLARTVLANENVFTPKYFAQHSRLTVDFQPGLDNFLTGDASSATAHWVEVGPHPSLLPMIAAQAPKTQAGLVPCLRKGVSPSSTLSQILSYFYDRAWPVDWRQAFTFQDQPHLVDLPGLPFFQSEFMVSYPHESSELHTGGAWDAPDAISAKLLFGRTIQKACEANGFSGIYETPIQSLKNFITGHIVCEQALCPASVYHQMVFSSVKDMEPDSTSEFTWSLADISYVAPLLYTSQSTAMLRIHLAPSGNALNVWKFEVSSFAYGTDPNYSNVHCKGRAKRKARKSIEQKYTRMTRMLERQIYQFAHPEPNTILETFTTKAMYENVFTRVVTFSELYQQVQFIRISPDRGEAYARCKYTRMLSTLAEANAVFMDVLLHVAGFLANLSVPNNEACICKEVASALVLHEPTSPGAMFDVYCTMITMPAEGVVIADAQAADERGVVAIFKGMVFQRVQLAKISHAFSMASRKGQRSPNTSKTSAVQRFQQNVATTLHPDVTSMPPATPTSSALSNFTVRELIAKTCAADRASLSTRSNLEELGFDSLLMIELEARLSSTYPQLNISGLAECITVEDVERLCSGQQALKTPPSTDNQPSSESIPVDRVSDIKKLTRAIVAETCSADTSTITSSSELAALGIDSLMIFELESNLLNISKDGYISSSELSECHTVGDVEKLVCALHIV